MDELIAWLARMLDADEAAAAVVVHEYSSTWKPVTVLGASDVTKVVDLRGFPVSPGGIGVVGEHIARYDPARVLREVAAKRAILAEHSPCYPTTYPQPSGQPTCAVCDEGGFDPERMDWPCPTIRHLVSVYSDQPGYKADWAP